MSKKKNKQLFDEEGNPVTKKPFYKRWWFIALVVLFVLYAIGSDTESDTADESVEDEVELVEEVETVEEEPEEVAEEPEDPAETPEPEPEPEVETVAEEVEEVEEEIEQEAAAEEISSEYLEDAMLMIMQESMQDMATIDLDRESKMFIVTPLDVAIGYGAVFAAEGDQDSLDAWNYLMENMRNLSETITEEISPGYSIALVNPSNTENSLALIMDGVIVYDAVRDQ